VPLAAAFAGNARGVKTVFSPGASAGEHIVAGVSVVSEYVSLVSVRDGKAIIGWGKSFFRKSDKDIRDLRKNFGNKYRRGSLEAINYARTRPEFQKPPREQR
jgi:hypothetical protein